MVSEYIITSATLKYVSGHVVLSAEVLYRVAFLIIWSCIPFYEMEKSIRYDSKKIFRSHYLWVWGPWALGLDNNSQQQQQKM